VVRVVLAQVQVVVRAAVVVRVAAYRLHLLQLIKFDGFVGLTPTHSTLRGPDVSCAA
jgi:hypothetical protein